MRQFPSSIWYVYKCLTGTCWVAMIWLVKLTLISRTGFTASIVLHVEFRRTIPRMLHLFTTKLRSSLLKLFLYASLYLFMDYLTNKLTYSGWKPRLRFTFEKLSCHKKRVARKDSYEWRCFVSQVTNVLFTGYKKLIIPIKSKNEVIWLTSPA